MTTEIAPVTMAIQRERRVCFGISSLEEILIVVDQFKTLRH
ncbi:hypothetical protein [Synechococcus sp. M16CYN]